MIAFLGTVSRSMLKLCFLPVLIKIMLIEDRMKLLKYKNPAPFPDIILAWQDKKLYCQCHVTLGRD